MKYTFPWPDSALNPNSSCHFRKKANVKKKQRAEYRRLTTPFAIEKDKPLEMCITFYPPNNYRRDLDNCLASLKSGIDGMCDTLGIDDRFLHPILLVWGDVRKYGEIEIELRPWE